MNKILVVLKSVCSLHLFVLLISLRKLLLVTVNKQEFHKKSIRNHKVSSIPPFIKPLLFVEDLAPLIMNVICYDPKGSCHCEAQPACLRCLLHCPSDGRKRIMRTHIRIRMCLQGRNRAVLHNVHS